MKKIVILQREKNALPCVMLKTTNLLGDRWADLDPDKFFYYTMEDKPNYYAILTANVRYDKRLRDKAKLLYAEITALSNKNGFCFANNTYFANLYEVSNTTISTLISELEKYGYIKVSIDIKKGNERKIYVKNCTTLKENLNTYLKNFKDPLKENLKHNNIYINNKSNNNKEKENKKEKMANANNFKVKQYVDLYNSYINNENALFKLYQELHIDVSCIKQLLFIFTYRLNKEKASNALNYIEHFKNWLNTDAGKKAIKDIKLSM